MRMLFGFISSLSILMASNSYAQSLVPEAFYNPFSGEVSFVDSEEYDLLNSIFIVLESDAGNLIPDNASDLNFSISEPQFQSEVIAQASIVGKVPTSIVWLQSCCSGFLDPSSMPTVSASLGQVVQPGTNAMDLSFGYVMGGVDILEGRIILVPEPSTVTLLLACVMPALARRCR